MRHPTPVTVDFETNAIEPRPKYPPEPVGVSIKKWGRKARYYAWAHRGGGNNCTLGEARAALAEAYANPDGVLMQNSKFDLEVAEAHLGLAIPRWDRVHDLLFLLFLEDPYTRDLGLKPCAARYLNWPPDERDAVAEWLIRSQPVSGIRVTAKNAIAHISHAPGDVAAPYANGDADRTEALFKHLWRRVVIERGMGAAYDRERRVMPVLLAMERRGVRVHERALAADVDRYTGEAERVDAWLRKRLRCGVEVNLDSDVELADALVAAGAADPARMGVTEKTGRIQTNKKALDAGVDDRQLYAVLRYRSLLGTYLGTFMRPWLESARANGGLIYTSWNQTRGDTNGGARSGRLSSGGRTASAGNFQNIPNEVASLFGPGADDMGRALPKCPIRDLPPPPMCRDYVAPHTAGEELEGRDYQGQELRVLGHYEDGVLLRAYKEDPWLDVHDMARGRINAMLGRSYARKPIKNLGFRIIYGGGAPAISEALQIDIAGASELRAAYMKALPGLKDIYAETRAAAAAGDPITTWGGREYFCEEPRVVKGRIQTYEYKLPNYLIQGSSADCTKEALIAFDAAARPEWKLLLQVHDEIVGSAPRRDRAEFHRCLSEAMASVEFDVPMLSEGEYGDAWGSMRPWDEKGVIVGRRAA